ncbi:MAG: hypothetical protein M1819_002858 [Sarea resinae]|nr:MAG: hypothetical protein M1819_002858 [Sarea resinae]
MATSDEGQFSSFRALHQKMIRPKIDYLLPAATLPSPPDFELQWRWDSWLRNAVIRRLNKHNIEWKALDLVRRIWSHQFDAIPFTTILIEAKSRKEGRNEAWARACEDIQRLCCLEDLELAIEIGDEQGWQSTELFLVLQDQKELSCWPTFRGHVLAVLPHTGWMLLQVLHEESVFVGDEFDRLLISVDVVKTLPTIGQQLAVAN